MPEQFDLLFMLKIFFSNIFGHMQLWYFWWIFVWCDHLNLISLYADDLFFYGTVAPEIKGESLILPFISFFSWLELFVIVSKKSSCLLIKIKEKITTNVESKK